MLHVFNWNGSDLSAIIETHSFFTKNCYCKIILIPSLFFNHKTSPCILYSSIYTRGLNMQVFQQILLTRLNKYIMLVIIIKHNIHLLPCLLFCETFGLFNSLMYMYTCICTLSSVPVQAAPPRVLSRTNNSPALTPTHCTVLWWAAPTVRTSTQTTGRTTSATKSRVITTRDFRAPWQVW